MPRFARVCSAIPGPHSLALHTAEAALLAPGSQQIATLSRLCFSHGDGALVTDVDDNTFIDLTAGVAVGSLGHAPPALQEALFDQAGRTCFGSFTSRPRLDLLRRVAAVAPGPHLQRTQLYSGGAEAVESALRLSRAHTGKHEVVGFWGGFHGKTLGTLPVLGSDFKHGLGPLPGGFLLSPYADCARCPFRLQPPSCGLLCVDFLRDKLRAESTGSVAAILVEPIQGTAGNVIPPPGWLAAVRDVARELGALLVVDEMITGWGRTGRMWGQQHDDVCGDIVTFGKGVASGFPVTGVLSSTAIVESPPWSRPSFSSSSFGGGPLAAAAADAVTRVIVEQHLDAHAATLGAELLAVLQAMQERHRVIAAVRGRGLLLGLDLQAADGQPLPRPVCERLFLQCLRRGLLAMTYTPRVRLNPPLCISREQALEGLSLLDEALGAINE